MAGFMQRVRGEGFETTSSDKVLKPYGCNQK